MPVIKFVKKIGERKLFRETFWSFAAKGCAFVFFTITNIFLARTLGVAGFGRWSFFFSIFTTISFVSWCGINASSKKFVAQYNRTGDLKPVLASSLKLRLGFSFLFALLLLLTHKTLANLLGKPELETLLLAAVPLVFLSGLIEYLKNVFTGLHEIKYHFIVNLFEYGLKLLLVLVFFTFSSQLISIVGSYTAASVVTVLVGLYLLHNKFYRNLTTSCKNHTPEILRYSLPLLFASVGTTVIAEMGTIMLGLLKNPYEVGIYSAARQIVVKLPQISLAITIGTMPAFAKINSSNQKELKNIFEKLLKINTLIFGSIALIILMLSRPAVSLFLGNKFSASATVLQILIPYLLLSSYSAYLNSILDYQGLAGKRAVNLSITVVLNIALNLALIPKFGARGAAAAVSLAYLPYLILNWLEVQKVLENVNLEAGGLKK